jgi:hypothetical protein
VDQHGANGLGALHLCNTKAASRPGNGKGCKACGRAVQGMRLSRCCCCCRGCMGGSMLHVVHRGGCVLHSKA